MELRTARQSHLEHEGQDGATAGSVVGARGRYGLP
jgi:hypothetical protein